MISTLGMLAYGFSDLFILPPPWHDYWWLMLVPLCAAVSVVYKSVRLDDMRQVPRQALEIFVYIIASLVLAGVGLMVLVHFA